MNKLEQARQHISTISDPKYRDRIQEVFEQTAADQAEATAAAKATAHNGKVDALQKIIIHVTNLNTWQSEETLDGDKLCVVIGKLLRYLDSMAAREGGAGSKVPLDEEQERKLREQSLHWLQQSSAVCHGVVVVWTWGCCCCCRCD